MIAKLDPKSTNTSKPDANGKPKEDGIMKCPTHHLKLTLYCDSDTCKLMLCKTCLANADHDDHRIYGLGALNVMPIHTKIEQRAKDLGDMADQLRGCEKQLDAERKLCETYQEEVEKINATEIGKTLLAQMGRNKDELIDICRGIMKTLMRYMERTKELLESIAKVQKQLDLNRLVEKNKTISEEVLEKEVGAISDPVMHDTKDTIQHITDDKIEEQLKVFKTNLSQPVPVPVLPVAPPASVVVSAPPLIPETIVVAGKRAEPEPAAEEEKEKEKEKPASTGKGKRRGGKKAAASAVVVVEPATEEQKDEEKNAEDEKVKEKEKEKEEKEKEEKEKEEEEKKKKEKEKAKAKEEEKEKSSEKKSSVKKAKRSAKKKKGESGEQEEK